MAPYKFTGNASPVTVNVTEVNTEPCITNDATASVDVTPALACDVNDTASPSVANATLTSNGGVLLQTVGTHVATFTASTGHAFAGGLTALDVSYTINAGKACPSGVKEVEPAEPTKIDKCSVWSDKYVIPSQQGVKYKVAGWTVRSGDYSTLGAQSVTITAVATSGYTLVGTTSWTLTFDTAKCKITPVEVTENDVCGTSNDTYTIPTTEHVTYFIVTKWLFGVDVYTKINAGTYPGSGSVTIKAFVNSLNYAIDGQDTWKLDFANDACPPVLVTVEPATPAVLSDTCDTTGDTYTIPTTNGVEYYVDGTLTAAGDYKTNGKLSVVVTAKATTGYTLGSNTSEWTLTFTNEACPVVPCAPTMVKLPDLKLGNTDNNCVPGMGGAGGPETPVTPTGQAAPLELPHTGPSDITPARLFIVILSGMAAYGATFFALNRREIFSK